MTMSIQNPITVTMDADHSLLAVFRQITTGKGVLDIHAYLDSQEVAASAIVDSGSYPTPASLELPPGNYAVTCTYQGVTKSSQASVLEGQTSTVDFQFGREISKASIGIAAILTAIGLATIVETWRRYRKRKKK